MILEMEFEQFHTGEEETPPKWFLKMKFEQFHTG